MWASPAPKYLAHKDLQDNAAGTKALKAGEWMSASSSSPTFRTCGRTTCRFLPA